MDDPQRLARGVATASIVVSAALAITKVWIGLAAHSVAVVSDGFESGADFFASGLVLLGLWIASKPADEDHPYGHGRFETLTGLAIGALLSAAGTGICLRSLEQRNDDHTPAFYAIWPLIGSILVKAMLATAKLRASKRTGSSALRADASNDLVDILSGTVALVAVWLAIVAPGARSADHYGGFAVGLIVVFLGLRVIRETSLHLVDTMPDASQMAEIRAAAMRVEGARGIEKCFARKTGLRYHVDLHLEVDPDLTVRTSHEIATAVREAIKADVRWVQDVLVHVEPHGVQNAEATIKR